MHNEINLTKIAINLEVSSPLHGEETLEKIRMELRKRMLQFVFEAIDAATGEGQIHSHFSVNGDIKLVN